MNEARDRVRVEWSTVQGWNKGLCTALGLRFWALLESTQPYRPAGTISISRRTVSVLRTQFKVLKAIRRTGTSGSRRFSVGGAGSIDRHGPDRWRRNDRTPATSIEDEESWICGDCGATLGERARLPLTVSTCPGGCPRSPRGDAAPCGPTSLHSLCESTSRCVRTGKQKSISRADDAHEPQRRVFGAKRRRSGS